MWLHCGAVGRGGIRERMMLLVWFLADFQSFPPLPISKLGPSGADSQMGGFVYVLGHCGSLQQILLWGWEFLPLLQPPQVFSVRFWGFISPTLAPWVAWSVSLLSCSSWFIHMQIWDHLLHQPPPCLKSSPPRLPVSSPAARLCPSYQSGWMFLLYTLVVGLPYSSIFWHFWLFLVFKFVVLLVVWGGTVYLPTPPSWPEVCVWICFLLHRL